MNYAEKYLAKVEAENALGWRSEGERLYRLGGGRWLQPSAADVVEALRSAEADNLRLREALDAAGAIVSRLIADDTDSHFFVVRQEIKAELLAYGEAVDKAMREA